MAPTAPNKKIVLTSKRNQGEELSAQPKTKKVKETSSAKSFKKVAVSKDNLNNEKLKNQNQENSLIKNEETTKSCPYCSGKLSDKDEDRLFKLMQNHVITAHPANFSGTPIGEINEKAYNKQVKKGLISANKVCFCAECVIETKNNFGEEKNTDISGSSIISQPKHQTSDVLKTKDPATKRTDGTQDQPKPKIKLTLQYPITSKNDLIKDISTSLKPINKNQVRVFKTQATKRTPDGTQDQPKPKPKLTVLYPITSENDLIKDISTSLKPINKDQVCVLKTQNKATKITLDGPQGQPKPKKAKLEASQNSSNNQLAKELASKKRAGKVNQKPKEDDIYCLCRQPEKYPMIGCDTCPEWYHGSCLNLTKDDIEQLEERKWKCPKCEHIESKVNGFIQIERINVETLQCKYEICEKIFVDKKSLNNHVQTIHKRKTQCQSVSSKNKEKLHSNFKMTGMYAANIASEYVHVKKHCRYY